MTEPRRIRTSEPVKHDPRVAVLRRLAERQDHFAVEEQLLRGKGEHTAAEGAHKYALWVLRAYRAELDNPR